MNPVNQSLDKQLQVEYYVKLQMSAKLMRCILKQVGYEVEGRIYDTLELGVAACVGAVRRNVFKDKETPNEVLLGVSS